MYTISKSKIIVSFIQNPCACGFISFHCIFIIACEICRIDLDFHSFRFSWFKKLCFCDSYQLDCRLFYAAFCVRCLYIKLCHILSSNISCIRNCYRSLSHCSRLYLYTFQLLLKCCIRQAISKWVTYLICIIPCITGRRAFCSICVSYSKNTILITGFIILVSIVNSLRFYFKPVPFICFCKAVLFTGCGTVRIGINSKIHHGRSRCGVYCVCIGNMSGWISLSAKYICNTKKSIHSWQSCPENRINFLIFF